MELRTIIYTTSKDLWIKRDFEAIYKTLRKTRGATVREFEVKYFKLPEDTKVKEHNGGIRIDWDWLKENCPLGDNNAVCLHISRAERDRLGLKHPNPGSSLGGSYNRNTGDNSFEFVVIADKRTTSYDGMTSFERIFIHELSHGFSHWRGVVDFTHLWDYTLKNIKGIYMLHDFSFWNSLVVQIEKLKAQIAGYRLHTPVDAQFMTSVTQAFGTPNPLYPTTRHHVGIDIAVPVGEMCYAPADGNVVKVVENDPILGNATYIEFEWKGVNYTARYLHQSKSGTLGPKKRGEYVGVTGNTGQSTGPHLHYDICYGDFDLTGINSSNFKTKFVDPLTL